ncbi:MAG: class I SAM-dependent methyltransferase [Candidatus Anammoximicrobium sp.]|nr:class I SAM-dependent methyltransferase [Candidatus Anammoximicrobium sp.]
MSRPRVSGIELIETPQLAMEYDSLDRTEDVHGFVADLLAAGGGGDLLDLGTGTAQIPVELCRQGYEGRIMAADLSVSMLEMARLNIEIASVIDRVQLAQADATDMLFADAYFDCVACHDTLHQFADPLPVLQGCLRVLRPGGLLFCRDWLRPDSEEAFEQAVQACADSANEAQRQLFEASLRAAFTLDEVRQFVAQLGYPADTVQATDERRWTWSVRKPAAADEQTDVTTAP